MRIALADDNQMILEGLRLMFDSEQGMEVVGQAGDGAELVRIVQRNDPEIVVTEVAMPHLNGIEATRQIKARNQATSVVALTAETQRTIVAQMIRAGATAYVTKDCAFEELVQAIRAVAVGKAYLGTDITAPLLEHYVRNAPGHETSAFETLTPREREVLQLVAEGQSTKKIATRMNLSSKTIEFHRHRVMKKLDLNNIAELTKYAIRSGITTLEN